MEIEIYLNTCNYIENTLRYIISALKYIKVYYK
jgi:hypothetical protein